MKTYKTEDNADLEFTFHSGINWEELDIQGISLPMGMKLVDFVVERDKDLLLVEVKDPSNARATESVRKKYFKKLRDNSILSEDLTPKARDSYTYIHLMMRDEKPIVYIVLLGLDSLDADAQKALLSGFKDRLLANLRKECHLPWKRVHIKDCLIMSLDSWNHTFKDIPVRRVSPSETAVSSSSDR